MDIDQLDRSIRQLEAELASYKAKKSTSFNYSTPNAQGQSDEIERSFMEPKYSTARDQSYNETVTPHMDNAGKTILRRNMEPGMIPSLKEATSGTKLTVEDEKYDLSKYLIKEDSKQPSENVHFKESSVRVPDNEPNITYRKKVAQKGQEPSQENASSEQAIKDKERSDVSKDDKTEKSKYNKPPVLIKQATYDGKSSWLDYKSHIEACAELGHWSEDDKALYLAVSLRGQAQSILGDLAGGVPKKYNELITALNERFSPPNQMELHRAQLRERKQRASESLPELGQSIKRLTNLAYHTAPLDVREKLAKEYFIDALTDSDIRLRIKQARPATLNDAIRHAVELEAFVKVEQKSKELKGYLRPMEVDELKELQTDTEFEKLSKRQDDMQKTMTTMVEEMNELKASSLKQQPSKSQNQQEVKKEINKVICYECGHSGHFARDCFNKIKNGRGRGRGQGGGQVRWQSYHRSSRGATKSQPGRQTVMNKTCGNSGIFVKAQICGMKLKLLVDTGATLTIISDSLYKMMENSSGQLSQLKRVQREIISATDEPLLVLGKTDMSIQIGDHVYTQELAIAKLSMDGVLGLDFLNKYNCVVDIVKRTLTIGKEEVPLISEGFIGCYRVSVSETCSIPSRSEIIVYGKVHIPDQEIMQKGLSLIEPEEAFTKSDRGLVARTLVDNNDRVPLRIMNTLSEVKVIHTGTIVASLSPVEKIVQSEEQDSNAQRKPLSQASNELLKRVSGKLNGKQRQKVKDLLLKHDSLFAMNDKELGKTGIVRHGIKTDNRPPVKQPLR